MARRSFVVAWFTLLAAIFASPTAAGSLGGDGAAARRPRGHEQERLERIDLDPRWGMAAPIVASAKLMTGGKTLATSHSRTVALADPHDPLSVQTLDDEVTVNGRTSHSHVDLGASPATLTTTSAANCSSVTTIDAAGRPTLVTPGASSLAPTAFAYYDASDPGKKGLLKAVTRGSGGSAALRIFLHRGRQPRPRRRTAQQDGDVPLRRRRSPDAEDLPEPGQRPLQVRRE